MNLIFLYGPPGVGKLTVGIELAALTGFKLWHNHVSIDAITPVFGWGHPSFRKMVRRLREMVVAEAAAQSIDLITTFVYFHPEDVPLLEPYFEPYESHGGRVCPVQLVCQRELLDQRIVGGSRAAMGKIANEDFAREYLEQHDVMSAIPDRESLTIDNTTMAPADAARLIAGHFGLATSRKGATRA